MTRIDFYQIQTEEPRLHFTCRLIDTIYRRGHQIYVHLGTTDECQSLDKLLWEFKEESFIPHAPKRAGQTAIAPVELGVGVDCADHHDVLINLSGEVPAFFSHFRRVGEVVPFAQAQRKAARLNYKYYQDRGYPLKYHLISNRPATTGR